MYDIAVPDGVQITCLYDMDVPRPETFNEAYLYEGQSHWVKICVTKR